MALLATADGPARSLRPADAAETTRAPRGARAAALSRPTTARLIPAIDAAIQRQSLRRRRLALRRPRRQRQRRLRRLPRRVDRRADGGLCRRRDRHHGAEAADRRPRRADRAGDPRRHRALPAAGFVRATDLKGRAIGDFPFDFASRRGARPKRASTCRSNSATTSPASTSSAPRPPARCNCSTNAGGAGGSACSPGAAADAAQPLLSPLYYIARAVQPFADVQEPRDANAAVAVPRTDRGRRLGDRHGRYRHPAAGRRGRRSPTGSRSGGTLVRFAGPHLAAATDSLIPVRLRHGDRVLGGSLTWQEEQPLASFSDKSPFAGMTVPDDVLIKRQVLAEPDGTLDRPDLGGARRRNAAGHRHAVRPRLAGSLPRHRRHQLVEPAAVRHLRRHASPGRRLLERGADPERAGRPDGGHHRALPAARRLWPFHRARCPRRGRSRPTPTAIIPDAEHPPGLYGTEEGFRSLNLLGDDAELTTFDAADGARRNASSPIRPRRRPTSGRGCSPPRSRSSCSTRWRCSG